MTKTSEDDAPQPMLLIIADISGYTRYMTANIKTLAHSQTIITELVKAIIREVQLPLEVAKLEGDAVFLYCRKQNGVGRWPEAKRMIGAKLLTFFRMFSEKVQELSQSTTCTCRACSNIDKLRLKVVVHSGEALMHHVFNFLELAGVDVIITHRLLKNSVTAEQYLLLTEAARGDVEFPQHIQLISGSEDYEEIGRIQTLVYVPDADSVKTAPPGGAVAPRQMVSTFAAAPFSVRFGKSWRLYCKLWLAPWMRRPGQRAGANGQAESSGARAGRSAFAVLTLLLAPIFLPVGAIFVLVHALKAPAKAGLVKADHEREHEHEREREHEPEHEHGQ